MPPIADKLVNSKEIDLYNQQKRRYNKFLEITKNQEKRICRLPL